MNVMMQADGLRELERRLAELDGEVDWDAIRLSEAIFHRRNVSVAIDLNAIHDDRNREALQDFLRRIDANLPIDPEASNYSPMKPLTTPPTDPREDIDNFIHTFEHVTSFSSTWDNLSSRERVSAAEADALVRNSPLLRRLEASAPEIVEGPLRFDSQYWIKNPGAHWMPPAETMLSEALFVSAKGNAAIQARPKPFYVGLFTSTGVFNTYGMWRAYLEAYESSPPFQRPRRTWAVVPRPDSVVREITSAAQWVDFVVAYPRRGERFLVPDWRAVAEDYDGIHMTLSAILATDGLCFAAGDDTVECGHWHMESTFWLRWCFESTTLVETLE